MAVVENARIGLRERSERISRRELPSCSLQRLEACHEVGHLPLLVLNLPLLNLDLPVLLASTTLRMAQRYPTWTEGLTVRDGRNPVDLPQHEPSDQLAIPRSGR